MEFMVAPPYGKEVLIGNWVHRRYHFEEKGNGILPGLSPPQGCEQHRTLSKETYTRDIYKGDECRRQFVNQRVRRIRNFSNSTASNVKLLDNPTMINNFTTTNTLLYEWLPKVRRDFRLQNKPPTTGRAEDLHEPDLLQSYGNLTSTRHFADQLKSGRIQESCYNMRTTYDVAYNKTAHKLKEP